MISLYTRDISRVEDLAITSECCVFRHSTCFCDILSAFHNWLPVSVKDTYHKCCSCSARKSKLLPDDHLFPQRNCHEDAEEANPKRPNDELPEAEIDRTVFGRVQQVFQGWQYSNAANAQWHCTHSTCDRLYKDIFDRTIRCLLAEGCLNTEIAWLSFHYHSDTYVKRLVVNLAILLKNANPIREAVIVSVCSERKMCVLPGMAIPLIHPVCRPK